MTVILDPGGVRDPYTLPLSTRRGTHIPNLPRQEWSPNSLRNSIEAYRGDYPDAALRSITAIYNCLGLPFAARRTWIEPDHTQMILMEDGYTKLPAADHAQIGDIVVYRHAGEDTHVGVLIRIDDPLSVHRKLFVLSKWGPFGEYTHPIDKVPPLFGKPDEFWTDRSLESDISRSTARN